MTNYPDISRELHVLRIGDGIKLIRPPQGSLKNKEDARIVTVADLMEAPNMWFCNSDFACVLTNEDCAEVCGMDSVQDSINKTAFDFLERKQALFATHSDKNVMLNRHMDIIEFDLKRLDGEYLQSLTFKFPWYDNEDKIIGTFGVGIIIGRHCLAKSLLKLISFGLFSTFESNHLMHRIDFNQKTGFYLSQREIECLQLSVRGKTAKQVANELGISRRTVEEYLDNIKIKMGVFSKAELINKAIDLFMEINT